MTIEAYTEDFPMLLEAGFVAAQHYDEDSANKLFAAAQILEPTSTAPKIGIASLCLHKLEVRRSIKVLEEVLTQEPDNFRARALLGISHLLSQDLEKGRKLLEEALKSCDDPPTKRLCELWMQVLDSKEDSPAQPKKPKEKS